MRKLGFILLSFVGLSLGLKAQHKPNVIFIYADDLGYGDLSCYGATKISTPNIDALAKQGVRFTNAHTTSATCTPSRFAVLTGRYPWRRDDTGIAPGDSPLLIDTTNTTLPKIFRQAGYRTAAIGKWHLGLGNKGTKQEWNGNITPGPREVGFDYSYIMAATLDRVPTVFIENHHIVHLTQSDPIDVNYQYKIGDEPTGKENPELLRMGLSNGHSATIVNGISRIGWMKGGHSARWTDQNIADTITNRATDFIQKNKTQPFFLYFASGDPHVPRDPHPRFVGKSGMGPRGDAILQLDWSVGEIMKAIDDAGIANNTIIIFSSDNGPVLDDGYADGAVAMAHGHKPAGIFSGGKYSIYEAGTRVPFIVSWPGKVAQGKTSNALLSQIDMAASFANYLNINIAPNQCIDSQNQMKAYLGKNKKGRKELVEDAGTLAIVKGDWKYIVPSGGPSYDTYVDIALGNSVKPQLYNLKKDPSEKNNLAEKYPSKMEALAADLEKIKSRK
ncbi:arylsulfatase [Pelobium manganitolerans]|uniref:Arylsulfatase n=1 Tax=Pelobium manganitolerans TaxID=1842495 RepID=A0A419S7K8_9SPHI|nr:arylsulfatase [Pelobium manganitolerans]RKD17271.1 arylsulfatase [Pelobium manganitolerans]